jgi:hypothetical protein
MICAEFWSLWDILLAFERVDFEIPDFIHSYFDLIPSHGNYEKGVHAHKGFKTWESITHSILFHNPGFAMVYTLGPLRL